MMPIRIMIVEDDPMVMEVNTQFIEQVQGFEIVAKAFTGKEAIGLEENKKPDLILLDFYLPDTDGFSLLKEWRLKESDVDVILITATSDSEHIKQSFRYGAIDYIVKPFRFQRLKQALQRYREMLSTLRGSKKLSQIELDLLTSIPSEKTDLGTSKGSEPKPIEYPKGINELTLKQIIQFLLNHPDQAFSAEEMAREIQLARVTVRRYLEYLASTNTVSIQAEYGTVGRPINRYKLETKRKD
jgi:two-component system response regulator DctR